MRLRVAVVALVALAAVACGRFGSQPSPTPTPAPTATPAPSPVVTAPRPVQLPQDNGAHTDFLEWWYWSGSLAAADGAEYGFHLVFFEGRLPGVGGVLRAAHFALTDHQRRVFSYEQRLGLKEDLRPQGRIDLELDGWQGSGSGDDEAIAARTQDYVLQLALSAVKPPAKHGDGGVMPSLGGPPFYYYSRTRMQAEGSLTYSALGRMPVTVRGTVWMDHQWGNFDIQAAYAWDWFGLQLADGSDLMLSIIRDVKGVPVLTYGTLVAANGEALPLRGQDIVAEPVRFWTSPRSGGQYPVAWRLQVLPADLSLEVSPVLDDQELDTALSTGVVYWEGEVRVSGAQGKQPIAGKGHLELTGYARPPAAAR